MGKKEKEVNAHVTSQIPISFFTLCHWKSTHKSLIFGIKSNNLVLLFFLIAAYFYIRWEEKYCEESFSFASHRPTLHYEYIFARQLMTKHMNKLSVIHFFLLAILWFRIQSHNQSDPLIHSWIAWTSAQLIFFLIVFWILRAFCDEAIVTYSLILCDVQSLRHFNVQYHLQQPTSMTHVTDNKDRN